IKGNALKFNTTGVGGNLTATTTAGTITQSGDISVTGTSSFSAGANSITLANAGNDFGAAVTLSSTGAAVSIRDTNALTLATPTLGANTGITAKAGTTLTLPAANLSTG